MGVPKPFSFLFGFSLLVAVAFGQPEQHNHVFHDPENQGISEIQNDAPNATAIATLQTMKNLNVVGFYVALRELYLTNGFAASLGFNGVILAQKLIPDFQFQELIRALENTRTEIKFGNAFLRRISAMIKLNEPESLIHEPWLIDLASIILDHSTNSKDLAYSIRDVGKYLIDKGYPRVGYVNGTFLRNTIKEWASVEFKNEAMRDNWTEPLVLAHHTIGPENFGVLGDVLESMPWLNEHGMYPKDGEYVRFYKHRVNSAISNADVAVRLLTGIRAAFKNATETNGVPDTLLNALAHAEILSDPNSPIFSGVQSGNEQNRQKRSLEEMTTIWSDILSKVNNEQIKTKFVDAAKKAISSGIGGIQGVKSAFIAGARLIKNLGNSVDNAKAKCQQLVSMASVDSMATHRFNSAHQILLKLNNTNAAGRQGYKFLFDLYLENKSVNNQFLFQGTRYKDLASMKQYINGISTPPPTEYLAVIAVLVKEKIKLRKLKLLINDSMFAEYSKRNFGIRISKDNARIIQAALQKVVDSVSSNGELLENLKSIRQILRTQNSSFLSTLSEVLNLSRDGLYMDVYDSFMHIYTMTAGSVETEDRRLAPFKGLESMIGTSGSYMEVFTAMSTIVKNPLTANKKCQFIDDFFTGIQDVDSVVQAFGVNTATIRKQNEAIIPVESLVELLRASASFEGLGKLLGFHTAYTVRPNPMDSARWIADMLVYLDSAGWK